MASPKVEVVIKNACDSIGEAPHWDDASQTLYYVDLKNNAVHRYNPATGKDEVRHLKDTVSLVVPRRKGGVIVGLGRRIALLEWDSEMVSTVQEVEPETGNRFNDGKCDAKGRLWAGTMGPELFGKGLVGYKPVGSLYYFGLDRSIEPKVKQATISNGLAWSNDNKTMYWIDTVPRKIFRYDFDVETGHISNKKTLVQFEAGTEAEYGFPDGMTVDTEGNLWVACYGAGAVFKIHPDTGKTLQKISIPALETTSVAWGGKNLDELYVTTARVGLTPDEFKNKWPLAGSLFKVTGTGCKGRPAYMYEG